MESVRGILQTGATVRGAGEEHFGHVEDRQTDGQTEQKARGWTPVFFCTIIKNLVFKKTFRIKGGWTESFCTIFIFLVFKKIFPYKRSLKPILILWAKLRMRNFFKPFLRMRKHF